MFRYYSNRLGRFLTPDPLAGSIANPQSLNRYGYVMNDPGNLIDPLGLAVGPDCVKVGDDKYICPEDPRIIGLGGTGTSTGGHGPRFRIEDWEDSHFRPDRGDLIGLVIDPGGEGGESTTSSSGSRTTVVDLNVLGDCVKDLFGVTLAHFQQSPPGGVGHSVAIGADRWSRQGASVPIVVSHDARTYSFAQISEMQGVQAYGYTERGFPYQTFGNNNNNAIGTTLTQIHELGHALWTITQGSWFIPEPGAEAGNALVDCVRDRGGIQKK
jgi:uncharacterized protein RhaS with RHS repeats